MRLPREAQARTGGEEVMRVHLFKRWEVAPTAVTECGIRSRPVGTFLWQTRIVDERDRATVTCRSCKRALKRRRPHG